MNQKEFFGSAISFFLNVLWIVYWLLYIHIKAKCYCMLNIRLLSGKLKYYFGLLTETHSSLVKSKNLVVVLLYSNYQWREEQFSVWLTRFCSCYNYYLWIKRKNNLRPNKQVVTDRKFIKLKTCSTFYIVCSKLHLR